MKSETDAAAWNKMMANFYSEFFSDLEAAGAKI